MSINIRFAMNSVQVALERPQDSSNPQRVALAHDAAESIQLCLQNHGMFTTSDQDADLVLQITVVRVSEGSRRGRFWVEGLGTRSKLDLVVGVVNRRGGPTQSRRLSKRNSGNLYAGGQGVIRQAENAANDIITSMNKARQTATDWLLQEGGKNIARTCQKAAAICAQAIIMTLIGDVGSGAILGIAAIGA